MRLAVLRPADRLESSKALAREMGFDVITASPLAIIPNEGASIDAMFQSLSEGIVEHVVFTSITSVSAVLSMARDRGMDLIDEITRCTVTAIGPATARSMQSAGIEVDILPQEFTSTGVVKALVGQDIEGKIVYLLRSDRGDPILVTGLQDAGAMVLEVETYRLIPQPENEGVVAMVREALAGNIDAFAFTSATTASTFVHAAELMGEKDRILAMLNDRIVSAIGPPTRRKLESMEVKVDIMPGQATFRAMLEAIRAPPIGIGKLP